MAGFFVGATRIYGQDVKRDEQKLRVFKVGTGHMGAGDIDRLAMTGDVIFTGLCDVSPTAFPKAARDGQKLIPLDGVPRFTDYREMLDRIVDQCDAVCVSTPDHTHACIALAAGAGGGCREPEGRLREDHGGRDGCREPRRLDGEGRRRGGSPGRGAAFQRHPQGRGREGHGHSGALSATADARGGHVCQTKSRYGMVITKTVASRINRAF